MQRALSPVLSWGILLAVPIFFLALREIPLGDDGELHAHFLDIGQGDSALLVSPSGKQIIIDGGPDLLTLEEIGKRMPFFDRTIELLVLSHPNTDHFTAFPELLRRYRIRSVLLTGVRYDIARYREFLDELKTQSIPVHLPALYERIDMRDGLTFDVLWPPADFRGVRNINDTSIVLRARMGGDSILFTGDIEGRAESALVALATDLHATVLKVPHHGSKTSSTEAFLRAVSPIIAVISAGKNNTYGHPHASVLHRLDQLGILIRRTDREGTVSLTLDGE